MGFPLDAPLSYGQRKGDDETDSELNKGPRPSRDERSKICRLIDGCSGHAHCGLRSRDCRITKY